MDEERLHVDAQQLGVVGVECVFGVNEGGQAALGLCIGDDLEGEGSLAGGLRAEYLDDPSARDAAHP